MKDVFRRGISESVNALAVIPDNHQGLETLCGYQSADDLQLRIVGILELIDNDMPVSQLIKIIRMSIQKTKHQGFLICKL